MARKKGLDVYGVFAKLHEKVDEEKHPFLSAMLYDASCKPGTPEYYNGPSHWPEPISHSDSLAPEWSLAHDHNMRANIEHRMRQQDLMEDIQKGRLGRL